MPRALPRALAANFGLLHADDQTALAAMPLIAVLVLQAGPAALGALVAAQGAAWLLVVLPAGALVDRWPRRRVLASAPLGAAAGFGAAILGALACAGAGAVVLGMLAGFAAVPALVGRGDLPAANARLELARAVATLAGPPLAGWCAGAGAPHLALLLAALMALGAGTAGLALRLPDAIPPVARPPLGRAVAEGAAFVLRHPLLRGVALCAALFNAAFAVQLAALVPYAFGPLGLSPKGAGLAAGACGAGLIAGALVAGPERGGFRTRRAAGVRSGHASAAFRAARVGNAVAGFHGLRGLSGDAVRPRLRAGAVERHPHRAPASGGAAGHARAGRRGHAGGGLRNAAGRGAARRLAGDGVRAGGGDGGRRGRPRALGRRGSRLPTATAAGAARSGGGSLGGSAAPAHAAGRSTTRRRSASSSRR